MRTFCKCAIKWLVAAVVGCPVLATGQELNLSPTYGGQGIALQVSYTGRTATVVAASGRVPPRGGESENFVPSSFVIPSVTAQNLHAASIGGNNGNQTVASLGGFDAALGGHHVTAFWVQAQAQATAGFLNVPTSGTATFIGLTVDGNVITATGQPNQIIRFPDGEIIINEQTASNSRQMGTITVNAIDFIVNGAGRVIAASATAQVVNSPTSNIGLSGF